MIIQSTFELNKKAWESCLLPIPRIEAFALPNSQNGQRRKPTHGIS